MQTASNRWRWAYERPPEVLPKGEERPINGSKRWREQQRREKGYAGAYTELAHQVTHELLRLKYTALQAWFGGQLCASGGDFNFEGNWRLAKWGQFSERTAQRTRAKLEADGLIKSYLVAPGERVPGQRRAVRRFQVVRDVRALRALVKPAEKRFTPRRAKKSRAAAASHVQPHTHVAAVPVSPVQPFNLHSVVTAWLQGKRETPKPETKREPAKQPAHVDPAEVDSWDEDTERTERGLEPKPARPPPE